jgi:uncharacterized membrane protein
MTTLIQPHDHRDAVRNTIEENSRWNAAYLIMNILATVIACCGPLENSTAVVIGAMPVPVHSSWHSPTWSGFR